MSETLAPSTRYEREQRVRVLEEISIRATRRSFLKSATIMAHNRDSRFVPQAHHKLIIKELQNIADGENDRLLVHLPPGSAKSTYGSEFFPAWFMAQEPGLNIIGAANTALLADGFSRKTMQVIRDNPWLNLKLGRESAEMWTTTTGGNYRAAGVGGVITGLRADLVIIDDPVRTGEEAQSENFREKQWRWFVEDLRSRMKPSAKIVMIMTRWHEDDLGGRMLARQPGRWRILNIPAIAGENDQLGRKPGEWLWDDDPSYGYGADLRAVRQEHETQGSMRVWNSLYMQDPRPEEGAMFKTAMIRTIPSRPLGGRAVRAWDIAASSQIGGNDPDWTVGVLGVQDVGDRFALCDVVRFRGGADEVRNTILATAALDGKGVEISIPQDPGAAGKNWAADIVKALRGFSVTVSPESGDKATRASPLASQVNVGNVDIVTDVSLIVGVANPKGPWNSVLLSELSGFPAATKDDQVDAAARAFNHINERGRPMRTGRLSGQLGRI